MKERKPAPMPEESIVNIAKRHGRFKVSLRWRDIPLQRQCNLMVGRNLLEKVGRVGRETVYVLPGTPWRIKNGYLRVGEAPRD